MAMASLHAISRKQCAQVWATEITVEYLRTGVFRWYSPWGGASEVRDARPGLDFIGLNYYGK